MSYGNFRVLSQQGDLLFRAAESKVQWYLSKGLAEQISDDTIRLTFAHKGSFSPKDEFHLAEKDNLCVVCGNIEDLTRHHVVPYWYRKNFPLKYKKHSSHDVLLVCRECHAWYEMRFANRLKSDIASEYDVPFMDKGYSKAIKEHALAKALMNHGNKMPVERQQEILLNLAISLGEFPSDEELKIIASGTVVEDNMYCHGQKVVEKVADLQAFVKRWREHFVHCMNPKFLPKGWEVDRSIEIDAARVEMEDSDDSE